MSTYRPAGVLPGCAGKRGLRPWFHAFCVRVRGGSELAVQSAHLLARSSQSHANCCPATAGDRPIVLAPLAKAASVRLIAQFLFDFLPMPSDRRSRNPPLANQHRMCFYWGRVSRTSYTWTGGQVEGGSAPSAGVRVNPASGGTPYMHLDPFLPATSFLALPLLGAVRTTNSKPLPCWDS